MKRHVAALLLGVGVLLAAAAYPAIAAAQQSQSSNYSVDEVFFGTGGQLCDSGVTGGNSTNYCADASAGALTVGNTGSTNYQADTGNNTNREEYIEFIVNGSSTDLGVLSVGSTASTTGSFSIKTYLASGGVSVINAGDPPTYSTKSFAGLTGTLNPSTIGSEQFGINLVDNATPNVGANPVRGNGSDDNQTPYFSYYADPRDAIPTGYKTVDSYKYVKGETIVAVPGSTGKMSFTVSYIYNINGSMPAGRYLFNHEMVATSTY